MATQAQIDANRRNAEKSCGPKTEAGKANSRCNRLSHGFAASVIFARGENREDFNLLLADLHQEFQPATACEQILLEKMVQAQWNGLRVSRLQSQALHNALTGQLPTDFGLLLRYQQTAERSFYKARTELLKSQKERPNLDIGFVPQTAESQPASPPEPPAPPQEAAPEPPAPEPPAPEPAPSIPPRPDESYIPDFDDLDDQLEAILNGPDGEIARPYIEAIRARLKAA